MLDTKEKLFIGSWLIGFACLVLAFVGLFARAIAHDAQVDAEHVAACHARGWVAASETEHHGKTSTTSRFCVDARGQVYWPEGM